MTDFSFNIGADIDIPQDSQLRRTRKNSFNIGADIDIPQDDTPFIVLYGPPACGKTMVLKSLANYLNSNHRRTGYSIHVNNSFINDKNYYNYVEDYYNYKNIPMPQTVFPYILDVVDQYGNTKVHILDAPGEDFFSYDESDREPYRTFPQYLNKIAFYRDEHYYRKVIYIIFMDLDSEISSKRDDTILVQGHSLRVDSLLREKYEEKMFRLYNQYVRNHPSKVILLYNKVDLLAEGIWGDANGCHNPGYILNDAKQNYPRLFFERKFLFGLIKYYYYKFLPFCAGKYYEDGSYVNASPSYSEALLKELLKYL